MKVNNKSNKSISYPYQKPNIPKDEENEDNSKVKNLISIFENHFEKYLYI